MVARAAQMRPDARRSAEEALRAAAQARRDAAIRFASLVVSDVHMPDVDGFVLAERIRQNPSFATSPIVFLTSAVGDSDIERCEACSGSRRG